MLTACRRSQRPRPTPSTPSTLSSFETIPSVSPATRPLQQTEAVTVARYYAHGHCDEPSMPARSIPVTRNSGSLRGENLRVAKLPITFKAPAPSSSRQAEIVSGELTLMGKSRPVTLEVRCPCAPHPMKSGRCAAASSSEGRAALGLTRFRPLDRRDHVRITSRRARMMPRRISRASARPIPPAHFAAHSHHPGPTHPAPPPRTGSTRPAARPQWSACWENAAARAGLARLVGLVGRAPGGVRPNTHEFVSRIYSWGLETAGRRACSRAHTSSTAFAARPNGCGRPGASRSRRSPPSHGRPSARGSSPPRARGRATWSSSRRCSSTPASSFRASPRSWRQHRRRRSSSSTATRVLRAARGPLEIHGAPSTSPWNKYARPGGACSSPCPLLHAAAGRHRLVRSFGP